MFVGKEAYVLKKILVFIFTIVSFILLSAAPYAADGNEEEYIGQCDCAFTVEDAHGDNKIAAIESANAQVRSGTSPEKTVYFSGKTRRRNIGDGYYTISETSSDMCFNVDADGANNDYEGIHLTVWEHTEDITQRFRLVMSEEDGSYTFYAACSSGGYSRAVGYDPYTGTLGLYGTDSDKCVSFFIKNSSAGNGMKYIVLSTDETKYLSIPKDPYNSALALLSSIDDEDSLHEWKISNWGDSSGIEEAGGEFAVYPGSVLSITQGPYDVFSHQEQNAIDMTLNQYESIVAPFTCRVVAVNEDCCNAVWIQSMREVVFADGTIDYMTCLFLHDNDISDIYVGEILLQGQPFYEMGTAGNATGEHCHISCFRGEYSPSMKINSSGPEVVNAWEAFFLPNNIQIKNDYGFPWVYLSDGVPVSAAAMYRPEAYEEGYAKAAAEPESPHDEPPEEDEPAAKEKPAKATTPKPAVTTAPKPAETTAPKPAAETTTPDPAETTAPEPAETAPEPLETGETPPEETTEEPAPDETGEDGDDGNDGEQE